MPETEPTLTAADFDLLRRANGVGDHVTRAQWGYRDYYAPGTDDLESLRRLEAAGLMTETHAAGFDRVAVFVTTEKGRGLFSLGPCT